MHNTNLIHTCCGWKMLSCCMFPEEQETVDSLTGQFITYNCLESEPRYFRQASLSVRWPVWYEVHLFCNQSQGFIMVHSAGSVSTAPPPQFCIHHAFGFKLIFGLCLFRNLSLLPKCFFNPCIQFLRIKQVTHNLRI